MIVSIFMLVDPILPSPGIDNAPTGLATRPSTFPAICCSVHAQLSMGIVQCSKKV